MKSESEVTQSCPSLCDPIDCRLAGSSVYWIFQAIVLEWIAISFSRGSSQPRAWTRVSHIVDRRFTIWATRGVLDNKKGWAPKNWCFGTVVLEKTLKSPFNSKEMKPVNPKGNQPEFSLEGLMLMLKLQYFGHLMRRTDSLEKVLMLGKIEGRRGSGWQRMRWLDGITNSIHMNLSKLGDSEGQGSLVCYSSWGHKESDTTQRPNNK